MFLTALMWIVLPGDRAYHLFKFVLYFFLVSELPIQSLCHYHIFFLPTWSLSSSSSYYYMVKVLCIAYVPAPLMSTWLEIFFLQSVFCIFTNFVNNKDFSIAELIEWPYFGFYFFKYCQKFPHYPEVIAYPPLLYCKVF